MPGERSRHAEDYIRGSSDRPITGQAPLKVGKHDLERKLSTLKIRLYGNTRDKLDVERTNSEVKKLISEQGLRPIILVDEDILYRVVKVGQDGRLEVSYNKDMPSILYVNSDNETVPFGIATEYLGVDRETLKKMRKYGKIRGTGPYVNLADLNNVRSNPL